MAKTSEGFLLNFPFNLQVDQGGETDRSEGKKKRGEAEREGTGGGKKTDKCQRDALSLAVRGRTMNRKPLQARKSSKEMTFSLTFL